MSTTSRTFDVVVVGAGNAGFAAALAAATRGRSVVIVEAGAPDEAGGNSYYTHGATRVAHSGLDELRSILIDDTRYSQTVVPPYSADEYAADITALSNGRNDPERTAVLVNESLDVLVWLHSLGMNYTLLYDRQCYTQPDGSYLFWGGLHVGNLNGGIGMIEDYERVAATHGIEILYQHRARKLGKDDGKITSVSGDGPDGPWTIDAESVILAAGGFHANKEWLGRHLGGNWESAVLRGTRFGNGDMIIAATEVGAVLDGDWDTAHATMIDADYPENSSNREFTNRLARLSYPLGIVVNADGNRFFDEGENFRNYTYSKTGKLVLEQPGGRAYQLFDAQTKPLTRVDQYEMPGVSVIEADSLRGLAERAGIDVEQLERTVTEFNASIDAATAFDATVLDGKKADLELPKSNWALPLTEAPFYAYPVVCGITFTYGGLASDVDGRVLTAEGEAIPGLFVTGEMLGGVYWGGYPGGTGLALGAVFGRRAGNLA